MSYEDNYLNSEKAWRPSFAKSEEEHDFRSTMPSLDEDSKPNVELEKGEVAVIPADVPEGDGLPVFWKIEGQRHHSGGTKANIPEHTFIFSRDKSLKISDKDILEEQFGITNPPPSGLVPADIAKRFNVNKYKKILMNANQDAYQIETAEMMIENFMMKLGKLALIQESMKGYPDGAPLISYPYMRSIGINTDGIENKATGSQQKLQGGGSKLPDDWYHWSKEEIIKVFSKLTEEEAKNAVLEIPTAEARGAYFSVFGPAKAAQAERELQEREDYNRRKNSPASNYETEYGKTAKPLVDPTAPVDPVFTGDPDSRKLGWQGAGTPQSAARVSQGGGSNAFGGFDALPVPLRGQADMDQLTDTFDPRLDKNRNEMINNLSNLLNDEEILDDIKAEFFKVIINSDLPDDEKTQLLALEGEDLKKKFIQYQKQNHALEQWNIRSDDEIFDDRMGWDRGFDNKTAKEALSRLGFGSDGIIERVDVMAVQGVSKALATLKANNDKPEVFDQFEMSIKGPEDPGNIIDPYTGSKRMSAVDGLSGNNTNQLLVSWKTQPEPEEVEKQEKKPDEIKTKDLKPYNQDGYAPWWIQDLVQTSGAFMDLGRVKKYLPWQAQTTYDEAEPTFYSPERALANVNEQLALGVEGAATFGSPQAYNARVSQMSGQAAKQSADVLGQYQNLNVGIANQFETQNTTSRNAFNAAQADRTTQYYDGTTIANQQYDNAKNQARKNLRDSYVSAITNRAQAQAVNTLFPNYKVNPGDGGSVNFIGSGGRKFEPSKNPDMFNAFMNKFNKLPKANLTANERAILADKYVQYEFGRTSKTENPERAELMNWLQSFGGP